MKRIALGLALLLASALMPAPGMAQSGDLFLVGVDPLLVQSAGGCQKIDSAIIRCGIKHGQYTYVYFESKKPKFHHCAVSVSRGPGEKWHVNSEPCVAKWNGNRVYISVPK